jgi:hypothetical protein
MAGSRAFHYVLILSLAHSESFSRPPLLALSLSLPSLCSLSLSTAISALGPLPSPVQPMFKLRTYARGRQPEAKVEAKEEEALSLRRHHPPRPGAPDAPPSLYFFLTNHLSTPMDPPVPYCQVGKPVRRKSTTRVVASGVQETRDPDPDLALRQEPRFSFCNHQLRFPLLSNYGDYGGVEMGEAHQRWKPE